MPPSNISSLSASSKNVELEASVVQRFEPRLVNTRYGQSRVMNTIIEDSTGNILLTIWGDDIDKVQEGNKIKVKKAYASEWNGKLQLNLSRFGKLLILN
ncbi:MAG: DNA-binding protein [Candidatus Aenigmarchaeota archaeon]|nr:DNA-binding protein [Candidatus Aenigmarchaeota archaeon]